MALQDEKSMEVGGEDKEQEERQEEEEYESDPEEAPMLLTMRRREASDDEEEEREEVEEVEEEVSRSDPRVSDGELDGQGGAAVYVDDDDEEEESEIEEEEEEEVEEEVVVVVREFEVEGVRSSGEEVGFDAKEEVEGGEGEKKENEPFAVPTAGAFYMHDDRFRDNGSGRHRRTPGGRKLWESKDDRKWGHDKFEEMKLQETGHEKEKRNSRGRIRGRGKNRGMDRGNARGSRPRAYDDRNNQNHQAPKTVRGRGPRRYEPPASNNRDALSTQNKQYGKPVETAPHVSSGRASAITQNSHGHSDPPPPRKHVVASTLSSASPPFYPSTSSKEGLVPVTQKRDLSLGNSNKILYPAVMLGDKFSAHPNAFCRKTVSDPVGQDSFYIDPVIGKFNNLQLQSSGSSLGSTSQSSQNKPRGRGSAVSGHVYQQAPSFDNVKKVPQQSQPAGHQRPAQNSVQPSLRASQQLSHHAGSGSRASTPPKVSPSSSEFGELDSPSGSSKSQTALMGKGKNSSQASGRGTFLYSGAQVMGPSGGVGVSHGDPNFPGTPALLPVMQFGGQHPGGLGVPAVGMALPGYVAKPGPNNEMTWVPFLAGAAGALGATYPYLAIDGGYYSRPGGQTSSSGGTSKENSTNKLNNGWKPPQRSELVNDEFGQRQNKPRRYSEMSFGQ